MTGFAEGSPYPPPAGAVPYPYRTGPTAPTGLAIATITLAVAVTVLDLATTAVLLLSGGDVDRFSVLAAFALLALLQVPVMVAAWVVTSLWLHRCRSNVDLVPPPYDHARSPVWAWLGWWVPIVSFWFPYQVVRDVQDAGRNSRQASPLGLWWTGWLVWAVASRVASRMDEAAAGVAVVASLALLVALGPWIRIVLGLTEDQRELTQLR